MLSEIIMPGKPNLLNGLRKDIIDNFELAIIVFSVIVYYIIRIAINPLSAAAIAIFFGVFSLFLYVYHEKTRKAIKRLGEPR
ncbi:MAG TPA: hypothetical protein VMS89_00480 [Methanoregulaceae archaeon]|nr:hypothetical protein [Methanoregulaceae archaeon]